MATYRHVRRTQPPLRGCGHSRSGAQLRLRFLVEHEQHLQNLRSKRKWEQYYQHWREREEKEGGRGGEGERRRREEGEIAAGGGEEREVMKMRERVKINRLSIINDNYNWHKKQNNINTHIHPLHVHYMYNNKQYMYMYSIPICNVHVLYVLHVLLHVQCYMYKVPWSRIDFCSMFYQQLDNINISSRSSFHQRSRIA